MEITAVETIRVTRHRNVIWVRIHTDHGIVGLGETWFGAGAVEAHIHDLLAGRLLGRDARRIEALNRDMLALPQAQSSTGVEYRAASAVDIALWDALGKLCGQPVHQLLGGLCHDRMRIYNTCAGPDYGNTFATDDAAAPGGDFQDLDAFMNDAGQLAENLMESGIDAMKIWPFDPIARANHGLHISASEMRQGVEPFEKIRKAVGDRMEIMVEFHALWNLPTAKRIARALEDYQPTWYEDPIRMNSPQALAEYADATNVWVCASETLGSRWPYKDMLDRGAMDVVMVDLCWTGGLTEARKIASLAEIYHRPFAPHDCIGPVGLIAGVHAALSQPNTLIQETVRAYYRGWYRDFVTELPHIEDGHVYPMEGAGLGTDLQNSVFERDDVIVRRSEA